MANIVAAQAKLIVETAGMAPTVDLGDSTYLKGHCGGGGDLWSAEAIQFTGSVPIQGSGADQVELGFVQIAQANVFQAFYAGRISSEGSIGLTYFNAPAMTQTIILDGVTNNANPPRDPWYRNPAFGVGANNSRAAMASDHPGMVIYLQLENRVRNYVPNYLFHAYMDRTFWTMLTAREPNGKLTYLMHCQWQLRYEFKLQWEKGAPKPELNSSKFTLLRDATAGRPTDGVIQAMLDSPSGPRANDVGGRAQRITESGSISNRSDNLTRFSSVSDGFWI